MPLERRPALRKTNVRRTRKLKEPEKSDDKSSDEDDILIRMLERRVTRARMVRKSMEDRPSTPAAPKSVAATKPLFDCVFRVVIETNVVKDKVIVLPTIGYTFPEKLDADDHFAAEFIFPNFSRAEKVCSSTWTNEFYMACETKPDGARRHIYCLKYLRSAESDDNRFPEVLALVTVNYNPGFYLELVEHMASIAASNEKRLHYFLQSLATRPYPEPAGARLIVQEVDAVGERIIEFRNRGGYTEKLSLSSVIRKMSPEVAACVIIALLSEQRVLITGGSLSITSQAVETFAALLRPLFWPHTLVPVVPDTLLDMCDNPTPYLMGIIRNNLNGIRELLSSRTDNDPIMRQDFTLFDVDSGLMIPEPKVFRQKDTIHGWKTTYTTQFGIKMGMPKKMTMDLIAALNEALTHRDVLTADTQVDYAVHHWFLSFLGHVGQCGGFVEWNEKIKRKVISTAPSKSAATYLKYFTESMIFNTWIDQKIAENAKIRKLDAGSDMQQIVAVPPPQRFGLSRMLKFSRVASVLNNDSDKG